MTHAEVIVEEEDIFIPETRRIAEIIAEKNLTTHALSQRIGIPRSTLQRLLNGQKPITPSIREKIAAGLMISTDRLRQVDTRKRAVELRSVARYRKKVFRPALLHALETAKGLLQAAVGYSERFDVLNDAASIHHLLEQYDLAHKLWMQALPCAEKVLEMFGDKDRLYVATNNLIVSYTHRRDYASLHAMLDKVNAEFFENRPCRAGSLAYAQAISAYETGDTEQYRAKMYESWAFFLKSSSDLQKGKAYHNIAYMEYRLGNYQKALEHYPKAVELLEGYDQFCYLSQKELVKTLLQTGHRPEALEIVRKAVSELERSNLDNLLAKFLFLQSIILEEPSGAERILGLVGDDVSLLNEVYDFLLRHYSKQGNEKKVMLYYKQKAMLCKHDALRMLEVI